jgi:hypothetical protein
VVETLRYQFLHRTAAAIYEAKRYRAKIAAMIVQSFRDDADGLADFGAFARALGQDAPQAGRLMGPFCLEGVSLYIAWIQDQPKKGDTAWSYLDSLRNYAQAQEIWCERVRAWCDEQSSKLESGG